MEQIIDQPVFGVFITFITYFIMLKTKKKITSPLFNPTFFTMVFLIAFLLKFDISFEQYNKGGQIISFLLGPTTVALAIPIYRQITKLRKNIVNILISTTIGSITGILSGVIIAKLLGGSSEVLLTIAPKSVTTPIAIEISNSIGGIPSLTAALVVIAGVFGAVFGIETLKIFNIKDPLAVGLGMGTSAHGLGTSRALQEGDTEGGFSGLSIGIAGIITAILVPFLVKLFINT